MPTIIKNINPKNYVPVLAGAPEELVTHRELRNKYQTNRSIKTWSIYFLLKSQTTSGKIQRWKQQQNDLADYCHCTVRTFKAKLSELAQLKLITYNEKAIELCSYETAAEILGIEYKGTIKIEYNEQLPGKQIFQYILRGADIAANQQQQLDGLMYHLDKNPLLKNLLFEQLIKQGADGSRLQNDQAYFQQRLLAMQLYYFKKGSDIWDIITQRRADINRSVNGIKRQHGYKSAQSVSYMKKRMWQLKLIDVTKTTVQSECRVRMYSVDEEGKKKEAARYCRKSKSTFWSLCDQLVPKFSIQLQTQKNAKQRAA